MSDTDQTTAIDGSAEELPAGDGLEDGAVEDRMGAELAVLDRQPAGAIIRAEEPDEIIEKATQIANSLKKLIDGQDLAVDVGGRRKHVEVGGWQALGTMLGALGGQPLHAETVWTRIACDSSGAPVHRSYHVKETRYRKKSEGGGVAKIVEYDVDGHDWEARVEVRTPDGVVVGSAEAMCSRGESTWATRPDPAVRSMAETRAESRAYRRAVGWIIHIAGYAPTPAEEMPDDQKAGTLPPWALAASDELVELAKGWLSYLAGGNTEEAARIWKAIIDTPAAQDEDATVGHVPAIVAQCIARVGTSVKRRGEAAAAWSGAKPPAPKSSPPAPAAAGEPGERSERERLAELEQASPPEAPPAEGGDEGGQADAGDAEQAPAGSPEPPPASTAGDGDAKVISEAQTRKLFAEARDAGLTRDDAIHAVVEWITGAQHIPEIPAARFNELLEALGEWRVTLADIAQRATVEDDERAQAIFERHLSTRAKTAKAAA